MRSHLDVRSLRSRLLCFETASAEAAAVHRAYCMPLQFDCRTTGKRKRERLPAWQLNSNNRRSHNLDVIFMFLDVCLRDSRARCGQFGALPVNVRCFSPIRHHWTCWMRVVPFNCGETWWNLKKLFVDFVGCSLGPANFYISCPVDSLVTQRMVPWQVRPDVFTGV